MMSPGPEPRVSAHPPHGLRSLTGDVLDSLQVDLVPNAASTQAAFNKEKGAVFIKGKPSRINSGHVQEG